MLRFVRWPIAVDFLALSVAFYAMLRWAQSARAVRMVLGVVGLHALALLARRLDLVVMSWVLDAAAILAILVLLLVFQPELRHAFMHLDSRLRWWPRPARTGLPTSRTVALASFALAQSHLGALLVITRRDAIGDLLEGGVALGAEISAELLEAIFQKVSPLHDGAAVITGDRLLNANVVLPLSKRNDLPAYYGTRHRAAVGLAERCDALAVAVSEERSEVTLMDGARASRMADREHFAATLDELLNPARESRKSRLRGWLLSNLTLKFAAVGLAALILGMSFLASGFTVRTLSIPIEFDNVPAGMEVASQSADTLDIQIQGSPWIIDSVNLGRFVGRFDLTNIRPGWHTLRFRQNSLALPPGVAVERVTPGTIQIEVLPSRVESIEAEGK